MKTELKNKCILLLKPIWSYQDIINYFGVSKSTALKIKERAFKETNGKVKYGSNYARTDSVLELFGTNRAHELELLSYEHEKEL